MKQVVQNYRTGDLKVSELPLPQVKPGHLLVRNHHSLISAGTEKSTISIAQKNLMGKAMDRPDLVKKVVNQVKARGVMDTVKMVFDRLDSPVALGYSCAGEVLAVGANGGGEEAFKVGDLVACAGQNFASHAEVVTVPHNLCNRIPEGVSTQDASYVAIASIAMQGVRQADPKLGDVVAVIGVGLLGQLVTQFLLANGCRVIAYDIDVEKLKHVEALGADSATKAADLVQRGLSLTDGHGVDSVIITASTKSDEPVTLAGELCRKKGTVVVVGAVGMNIPRETYYAKELSFKLSTSYGPGRYDSEYEDKGNDYPYGYVRWTEGRNMSAFLQMLSRKSIDLSYLTTHSYDISQANEAYDLIMNNSEPYLGVVIAYEKDKVFDQAHGKISVVGRQVEKAVSLGIIGAGNHVKDALIPPLMKNESVGIKGVCSSTPINAQAGAEKLEAAFCTTDSSEIFTDKEINAVLIGTPHNSHGGLVIEALKANKHVFVEKPLCLNRAELKEVLDAYKAHPSLHLAVGFNRRFSTHIENIKNHFASVDDPLTINYRINAGAIPAEHWVQDPKVGGGRIIGEVCHFLDTASYIASSPISSVMAISVGQHSSGITNDKVNCVIQFANGSIGSISYCADGDRGLPKEYLEVFGGGLSATMDDFKVTKLYKQGQCKKVKTSTVEKGFDGEMQDFVNTVLGQQHGAIRVDSIVNVTEATFAVMESLSLRAPVAV